MRLVLFLLTVLAEGAWSGLVSKRISDKQWHRATIYTCGWFAGLAWTSMIQSSTRSLLFLAVLNDIVYATGCFGCLAYMGGRTSLLGLAGIVVATIGLVMIGQAE